MSTESVTWDGVTLQHPPAPEAIPGLVWAFRIHSDGRAESLDVAAPLDPHGLGLLWLHFNLADVRAHQWLVNADLKISAPARQLLVSKGGLPQMHAEGACIYGVISDFVRAIDAPTEQIGYLHFVMTERVLISGRHHQLCSIDTTRRMLEEGARIGSAVELLEMVVSHVADTMEQLSVKLGADLDDIEEKVLSEGTDDRRGDLGRVRRTCVRLHRHLSSLRLVFHRLDQNRFEKAADAIVLDVSRLARRLDELDHDIMAMRERSRVLQEELHLKIEEQSNKSLHLLSVLTSLMLPPTLITGIFGMNTKGLPLTDTDSGFLWAMVLLIGSSLTAFYLMKRLHIMR